jgi:hypothetical protein
MEAAIMSGDVARVEMAIKGLRDPGYINKIDSRSGHTPLNLACLSANCEIIDMIIDKGNANLVNEDAKGRLPLHCAAESKNVEVVERIVHWLTHKTISVKGNWLNKCLKMKDMRGWTVLHAAIFGPDKDASCRIVRHLMEHMPETGIPSGNLYICQPKSKYCPAVVGLLHKAILCGSGEMAKLLVRTCVTIYGTDTCLYVYV